MDTRHAMQTVLVVVVLVFFKVGKAVCAVKSIRLRKLMIFMKRIFVDLSMMKMLSGNTLYNPSATCKLSTLRLSSELAHLLN